MSQIVTHSNILDLRKTFVVTTTARHSSEIVKDLLVDEEVYEVVLSKNSVIQYEPFDIKEGDIINVLLVPKGGGGGKNILSLVAMIAVAVYAPVLASEFIGAVGLEVSATGFYAIQAGVVLSGALLVNAVFGQQIDTSSLNSDLSSSTTYSWDESYNKFTQGLPIPKVFGTHKLVPPLISKYIETIDNKQYFNGLYAVNDGLINTLTDIKINDESIDNFTDVTLYIRNGTINQSMIPNFDNTRSDKGINKKLSTTFSTAETNGNAVVGLVATLLFPRGLFYANNDGSIGSNSVKITLEYSTDEIVWNDLATDDTIPQFYYGYDYDNGYFRADGLNGNFIEWVNNLPAGAIRYRDGSKFYKYNEWYYTTSYTVPYTTITDSSTSTLRKTFKVSNLPPNKYYIRAKFYENPPSGTRYGSDCYLEYITEEIGDDFIYPSTALISIRALATDQLSGSNPKISCVVTANTDNPALISKQILTEVGITSDRFLPTFDEWEDECTIKGYKCNIVFDQSVNVQKALQYIGTIGRASVVQFGSKFEVVMDRAEEIPVQSFTFGMGNILKDSFRQSFLPILDRANVLEVTYYDANNDFEPTVVEISNSNYDSVAEENRTAITLIGCTDRIQAIKHARYQLNCNRYLTETLTIEADKDSLVCKYGDIVRVSHDVPQYGFSGRIVGCTSTTITLDREITLEVGKSYYIQVRNKNNYVYEHTVINTQNTTNTLSFVTPVLAPYDKYDNYAFGEIGKASKLYRVLKIGTKSDLTRSLELVEYNEDVYNDSGDINVPLISDLGLSNLRATDYIRYAKDGSIETVMQLAWSGTSIKYTIQYKKTNGSYVTAYSFDNKIDLVVDDATYDIVVTDALGNSATLTYTVIGKTAKPESPSGFTSSLSVNGVQLKWNSNIEIDVVNYEVRDADIGWGDDNYLWKGYATSVNTIQTVYSKTYYIKALDSTNNYSELSSSTVVNISQPTAPTSLTSSFSIGSSSMAITTLEFGASSSVFGIDYYLIDYNSEQVKVYTTKYQSNADWLGNRDFSVTAIDKMGFSSNTATISVTKLEPNTPSNFRSQVIDNNVLFYWNEPSVTSLPITSYELRRGATWDTATVIGKKSGAFTTVFESVAGNYTYWIASIDADNRYSSAVSVATTVSQPPDFVLNAENTSTLNGTKSNAILEYDGTMLALVNTTQTWSEHFTSRGWTTPQAQINAGYPLFIQPSTTTAYYEETIDLVATFASSRITINLSGIAIAGSVSVVCDISTSADGTTWSTFTDAFQVYATNFRYYKFKLTFTSSDDKGVYKVNSINSVVDAKLKNDAGTAYANSSDVGGTTVNFNIPFVDVQSITITPMGITPLTAVYDFSDVPNPTSFKVLLFNSSGTRVSGNVSWSVKGN